MLKNVNLILWIVVFTFMSLGCSQIKTRREIPSAPKPPPSTSPTSPEEEVEVEKESEEDFQTAPEVQPQKRSAPRLGLILGAGGARAFAHSGVLKALDAEKIPVQAVVGLEWGSLIAGLYAQEGRAHNLEWKLYKLKESDLPGQSLLSKAFSKDSVSTMSGYLKTVFSGSRLENAKVSFTCPSISTQTGSTVWLGRGGFRSVVEACLPYPPLFASKGGKFASPFALEAAAQWLRRQGADVVVFIDVLSEGQIWSSSELPSDESARLLWWAIRQEYRQGAPGIDEIIKVPLSSYNLGDFQKRKTIAEVGLGSGRELTRRLMQSYNF